MIKPYDIYTPVVTSIIPYNYGGTRRVYLEWNNAEVHKIDVEYSLYDDFEDAQTITLGGSQAAELIQNTLITDIAEGVYYIRFIPYIIIDNEVTRRMISKTYKVII